jgi:hypothetical protein
MSESSSPLPAETQSSPPDGATESTTVSLDSLYLDESTAPLPESDSRSNPSSAQNTPNQPKKKRKKRRFLLAPSNFFSQILFLWVIQLIYLIQKVPDIKQLHLTLSLTETSTHSGNLLEDKWHQEVQKYKE